MPALLDYVGEVLDDKYRLDQLLGQGGMGAVYLATHLGTERYVALKLITPQFMRNEEFVERFKREARAAGRLRHPNVVDVTDFGFAQALGETVAYLVMEYLDGCTLGDVLAEEQRLHLDWVVDIIEQVCSAVNEAHHQGIVHRDLKPENIWLEPNRLGGYRVKVLDFGIAKLGQVASTDNTSLPSVLQSSSDSRTQLLSSTTTNQLTGSEAKAATAIYGNDSAAARETRLTDGEEGKTQLYTAQRARVTALHHEGDTQIHDNGGGQAEAPTLISGAQHSDSESTCRIVRTIGARPPRHNGRAQRLPMPPRVLKTMRNSTFVSGSISSSSNSSLRTSAWTARHQFS